MTFSSREEFTGAARRIRQEVFFDQHHLSEDDATVVDQICCRLKYAFHMVETLRASLPGMKRIYSVLVFARAKKDLDEVLRRCQIAAEAYTRVSMLEAYPGVLETLPDGYWTGPLKARVSFRDGESSVEISMTPDGDQERWEKKGSVKP